MDDNNVSSEWFPSVAGLSNLYSVIDEQCTLKEENKCYAERTLYMTQAVPYDYVFFHEENVYDKNRIQRFNIVEHQLYLTNNLKVSVPPSVENKDDHRPQE